MSPLGHDQNHLSRVVPDRAERDLEDACLTRRLDDRRFEADQVARRCPRDRLVHRFRGSRRVFEPDRVPEWLSNHFVRFAATEFEGGTVRFEQRPVRVEEANVFICPVEDGAQLLFGIAQGLFRLSARSDVHCRRYQVSDAPSIVPQRRELEIYPHACVARHAHGYVVARGFAARCGLDGSAQPCLGFRREVPPVAIPEFLADDVGGRNSGGLERCPVCFDDRSIGQEHADEGEQIVQQAPHVRLAAT